MKKSRLLPLLKGKFGYFFWVGVFFVGIFGLIYLLYFATSEIDYIWRWYRLPKYFANNDPVKIQNVGFEGTVESISREGNTAVIKLKNEKETKTYTVPAEDIRVSENDFVYPGDVFVIHYTVECIVVVLLGGAGTLVGPVMGGLVYGLSKYWLAIYWPGYHLLIFAIAIIIVIVLFPEGIGGYAKRKANGTRFERFVI